MTDEGRPITIREFLENTGICKMKKGVFRCEATQELYGNKFVEFFDYEFTQPYSKEVFDKIIRSKPRKVKFVVSGASNFGSENPKKVMTEEDLRRLLG